MSEENKDTEEKVYKIPSIPLDAIVSIEVSGGFLHRLKNLFYYMVTQRPEEDVVQIMKPFLESGEPLPQDHELYNMQTIVILLQELENKFNQAGLIKELDIKPSDLKNEG